MTIKFASQVGTLLALVGLQSSPIKVRDVGRSVSNFDPFGLSRAGLGLSARRQGECGSMLSNSSAHSTERRSLRRLHCRFCFAVPARQVVSGSRRCVRCLVARAFGLVSCE
jgi:hypothetical protein